ncbi:MAG: YgiQ family radical SAM protein [bacterium]
MFLPATRNEMQARGWEVLDVILVTGDAYIDSPFAGVALIGRVLEDAGFRVGVIAQPDVANTADISRLGAPRLFWGVTAGCVDSMVANYTATGRKRREDDFTPGGLNNRRPDRATIVYANLIRRAFRPCAPIVLGGIEASLRRIAHYDFWTDRIRKSILFDAKADVLVYGMAELTVLELARCLRDKRDWRDLRGICYASSTPPADAVVLPSYEALTTPPCAAPAPPGPERTPVSSPSTTAEMRHAFLEMFRIFAANQDPVTARILAQPHDARWLVHQPPALLAETGELDRLHGLPFERDAHPLDIARGPVRALDTIRFSLTTHRGCFGECTFCAITMHQGRRVVSRSADSIVAEALAMTRHAKFHGILADVGGPTANMYGMACARMAGLGACPGRRCLSPEICNQLHVDHSPQTALLRRLRALPGVRKAFVASGLRHDLVLADRAHGPAYLEELVAHHVSGQLKLAPEHSDETVLRLMGKPGVEKLLAFRAQFVKANTRHGLKQFLTYYFLAAHPGCTEEQMQRLRQFATQELRITPEQVQIFTPTPSTWATAMYWTGQDPATGQAIFVEKGLRGKQAQKDALTASHPPAAQKPFPRDRAARQKSSSHGPWRGHDRPTAP